MITEGRTQVRKINNSGDQTNVEVRPGETDRRIVVTGGKLIVSGGTDVVLKLKSDTDTRVTLPVPSNGVLEFRSQCVPGVSAAAELLDIGDACQIDVSGSAAPGNWSLEIWTDTFHARNTYPS